MKSALHQLLEPTPGSRNKLLAAWDGLSTESRIQILDHLIEDRAKDLIMIPVANKALTDGNAYVRYLAVQCLALTDAEADDKTLADDPSELVRYSHFECRSTDTDELTNPERFFALPQVARLAILRSLASDANTVAYLIGYAIDQLLPQRAVSETEIAELLLDYLCNPEFRRNYDQSDSLRRIWFTEEALARLWALLPRLGGAPHEEAFRVGAPLFVMMEHLPPLPGEKLEKLVSGLDKAIQAYLLDRPDLELTDLRRAIFFGDRGAGSDYLVRAAASHHLWLDDEDFPRLRFPNGFRKSDLTVKGTATAIALDRLQALRDSSSKFDPVIALALDDYLTAIRTPNKDVKSTIEALRNHYRSSLSRVSNNGDSDALRRVRLYHLARECAQKSDEPRKPSQFCARFDHLDALVVPGEPWETFQSFYKAWQFHLDEALDTYVAVPDPI